MASVRDNDLLDLWLLAGLAGGLDEGTAKRLLEDLQEERLARSQATGSHSDLSERFGALHQRYEHLQVRVHELSEALRSLNTEMDGAVAALDEAV